MKDTFKPKYVGNFSIKATIPKDLQEDSPFVSSLSTSNSFSITESFLITA